MSDFDSPWKEILERYFESFVEFYFPDVHARIDWTQPVEFLDKELQRVVRDARQQQRIVDKLARVHLKDGREEWVLIHVEVQGASEKEFAKRMYVCHYRIFDRYDRRVASLAVLTDAQKRWRPCEFGYEVFGCRVQFEFPIVKLIDFRDDWAALEASRNPFAVVTMAHLKTIQTRNNPPARRRWKFQIVQGLYEYGFQRHDVINLFRFIDWMMDLPADLSLDFDNDLEELERAKEMPYVTNIERRAIERGLLQGMEKGLEKGLEKGMEKGRHAGLLEAVEMSLEFKFADAAQPLLDSLREVTDDAVLRAVQKAVVTGAKLPDIKKLLAKART